MRTRFFLILLFSMLLILIFSVIITYNAVRETQTAVDNHILSALSGSSDSNEGYTNLKKRIELYRAFFKKRAVEITRKSMYLYLGVIFVMTTLLLLFSLKITKPILRLAEKLSDTRFIEGTKKTVLLKEKGSYEIQTLIRAFNKMILHLKEYRDIVGDKARYQGWKEISRIIVHEINNLVSPVETYTGYLMEKVPESEREVVSSILIKLGEMKGILLKLKNLSHLPKPELEYISVNELIEDILPEFSGVSFLPCTGNTAINIDRLLFSEIIRNIIKNAFETKRNIEENTSVSVVVSCEERVEISIKDDGGGIPEDIMGKIFLPGFSTKPGSIGIGLALVRSLAEEMGLKVEVSNEVFNKEKKGTLFKILVKDYI